jgi:hypothetical protein
MTDTPMKKALDAVILDALQDHYPQWVDLADVLKAVTKEHGYTTRDAVLRKLDTMTRNRKVTGALTKWRATQPKKEMIDESEAE